MIAEQELLDKITGDFNDTWYEECAKGMRNRPMTINLPRSFGKTFYFDKKVKDD